MMEVLIKQTSEECETAEDAFDLMHALRQMEGCVFGYVNIDECKSVSFHQPNPPITYEDIQVGNGQTFARQEYVLVLECDEDRLPVTYAKEIDSDA